MTHLHKYLYSITPNIDLNIPLNEQGVLSTNRKKKNIPNDVILPRAKFVRE